MTSRDTDELLDYVSTCRVRVERCRRRVTYLTIACVIEAVVIVLLLI